MSDDVRMAARLLGNDILYDDLGLWSVMVPLPKLLCSDILTGGTAETHPAWIVDDKELDVIWMSKYQNVVYMDRAYSLPHKDPAGSLDFDTARSYCRNKGAGWHLQTNALWAAIALWCKKNGTQPHGNNNYGQDISAPHEKAVPSTTRDSSGRIRRTYTGSSNPDWYHNHNISGIEGLNGNMWEWCGGLRLQDGEIQIIPYGNAMKDIYSGEQDIQGPSSGLWQAILPDGTLIAPGTEGTLKWDYLSSKITLTTAVPTQSDTGRDTTFETLGVADGITIPVMLKALGIHPADTSGYEGDVVSIRTAGERLLRRGGNWRDGAGLGVFALSINNVRTSVGSDFGFRAAYADPTAL